VNQFPPARYTQRVIVDNSSKGIHRKERLRTVVRSVSHYGTDML
jgi:hypothetical protein